MQSLCVCVCVCVCVFSPAPFIFLWWRLSNFNLPWCVWRGGGVDFNKAPADTTRRNTTQTTKLNPSDVSFVGSDGFDFKPYVGFSNFIEFSHRNKPIQNVLFMFRTSKPIDLRAGFSFHFFHPVTSCFFPHGRVVFQTIPEFWVDVHSGLHWRINMRAAYDGAHKDVTALSRCRRCRNLMPPICLFL